MADQHPPSVVIDTSAVASIFLREPDAEAIAERITMTEHPILPVSCLVEFLALNRLKGDRRFWIGVFIEKYQISLASMTPEMGWVAGEAALRYGRGSEHPAKLNFGDCMSYACAKHFEARLLYKGDDFALTDIPSAMKVEP